MKDSLDKCYPKIPERHGKYFLFLSFFKEKKVDPGHWRKHITNKQKNMFLLHVRWWIVYRYDVHNSILLMPITLSAINVSRNAFYLFAAFEGMGVLCSFLAENYIKFDWKFYNFWRAVCCILWLLFSGLNGSFNFISKRKFRIFPFS